MNALLSATLLSFTATMRRGCALALLLVIGVSAGCETSTTAGNTAKAAPPAVTVAKVVKRNDVITSQFFTGTVRESERVDIRARVQGYLEKIHFEDGADVKQGQPLFDIERQQHEARLAGAQALLSGASNRLREAEDRVTRGKAAGTAISKEEMATRVTQRDVARAAVEQAEASAADAKINLSYTKISSPIDGRIGRRLVDAGNLVGTDGNTLLTTVVTRQPIQVYFEISGPIIDRVQRLKNEERKSKGAGAKANAAKLVVPVEAELTDEKRFPHKGTLDYIDFEVDSTTGTVMVRGLFKNEKDLLFPGAFVRVRIPSRKARSAVMVEDQAIGTNVQGRIVLIVADEQGTEGVRKNIVQVRPVELGELIDGMRVVTKGLSGGETYIVNGLQRARPGKPVQPETRSDSSSGEKSSASQQATGESKEIVAPPPQS